MPKRRAGDERDERKALRRGGPQEPTLALIGAQDTQPIENRRRIPQGTRDRKRADTGAGELVLKAYGQLADPVIATRGGDREQFEIEREALDDQQRQDVLGNPSAEHLEAHLRIAHVESE